MALALKDTPLRSSPTSSVYCGLPGEFEIPASSPLDHATKRSARERRPPTITPKRFTRFFAPRPHTHNTREAARALQSARKLKDITRSANNVSRHDGDAPRKDTYENASTPQRKRRRVSPQFDSSPMAPSPSKRSMHSRPIDILEDSDCETDVLSDNDMIETYVPRPLVRVTNTKSTVRILERSFGGLGATGRGRMLDHCQADWRHDTAHFYTTPRESYRVEGVPFCSAACQSMYPMIRQRYQC